MARMNAMCAIPFMIAVLLTLLATSVQAQHQTQAQDTRNDFRAIVWASKMSKMPPMCRPVVLDRALHCGCFGYRRFYREYKRWKSLDRICQREFKDQLKRKDVIADCERSKLLNTNIGKRKTIDIGEMNDFFKNATETCMVIPELHNSTDTEKPKEKPYDSPEPEVEESSVTPEPIIGRGSDNIEAYPETSSATLDAETRMLLPEGWNTVHLRYRVVHKMLSRFCLVVMDRYRPDLSKARAYKKCCPRG